METTNENNPFVQLSHLFVENQRQINTRSEDLKSRVGTMSNRLNRLSKSLEKDVFEADLTSIINLEEEAGLIISVAKELEYQKEQVENALEMLTASKKIKLNK